VPGYGALIKSGLTDRRKHVVRDAFLPGRNTLLLLAGAAYARTRRAEAVCIGLLDEAHHLFPDQTSKFLAATQELLRDSVAYPVTIKAPLAQFTKAAVVDLASKRGITGTYSCHLGSKTPCGKCISCAEFRDT
jgi:7-cyano-7-deazaguanine synthase